MQKGGRHYFRSCFIGFIPWLDGSIVLTLRQDSTPSQGGYRLAKALISGKWKEKENEEKGLGTWCTLKRYVLLHLLLETSSHVLLVAQGAIDSASVEPNDH